MPLDIDIARIAERHGLVYTRYADDIALSSACQKFSREEAINVIHEIYDALPRYGLRPNPQKASISSPGARKIVLGLLVDGSRVRLSRQFRNRLECHLFFAARNPVEHAKVRGFNSVLGLRNHLAGIFAHARQIDQEYVEEIIRKFGTPQWPLD